MSHTIEQQIVTTIVNQLGGNQFVLMTGAQLMRDGAKLIVKFKGSKVANYMTIVLNSMDTYDVQFSKVREGKQTNIREYDGMYCDQIRNLFERVTGLRTSLSVKQEAESLYPLTGHRTEHFSFLFVRM